MLNMIEYLPELPEHVHHLGLFRLFMLLVRLIRALVRLEHRLSTSGLKRLDKVSLLDKSHNGNKKWLNKTDREAVGDLETSLVDGDKTGEQALDGSASNL